MADDERDLLPLFPLGHVLMPGCALPLRIFEPRYRRMLADVTGSGKAARFGVVSLAAGLEVGTGLDEAAPRFHQVGTVAEIIDVETNPDGTSTVLTGGSRRFRIRELVDGMTPYLQAEVSYLDEPIGDLPPSLPGAARALAAEYARLITAISGAEVPDPASYPSDPSLLSYRLATDAPMTPTDHQQLLEDETATARLLHVQRVLRREVVLLRRTRSIAVAPGLLEIALGPN